MKIGVLKRILKEDLAKVGGDLPNWIDALLSPLNQFINVVSQALSNNLTIKDNFSGRLLSLEFTHGVEVSVDPQTKNRVYGVFVMAVEAAGASSAGETATLIDSWGWVQKSNGKIGITFNFVSGSSSVKRDITLFLLTG